MNWSEIAGSPQISIFKIWIDFILWLCGVNHTSPIVREFPAVGRTFLKGSLSAWGEVLKKKPVAKILWDFPFGSAVELSLICFSPGANLLFSEQPLLIFVNSERLLIDSAREQQQLLSINNNNNNKNDCELTVIRNTQTIFINSNQEQQTAVVQVLVKVIRNSKRRISNSNQEQERLWTDRN